MADFNADIDFARRALASLMDSTCIKYSEAGQRKIEELRNYLATAKPAKQSRLKHSERQSEFYRRESERKRTQAYNSCLASLRQLTHDERLQFAILLKPRRVSTNIADRAMWICLSENYPEVIIDLVAFKKRAKGER